MSCERHIHVEVQAKGWNKISPDIPLLVKEIADHVLGYCLPKNFKGQAEISVVLTDDRHIQRMNRDYRGKNKPTNVLSFPQQANMKEAVLQARKKKYPLLLGDVVLSLSTLQREARAQKKPLIHHFYHLLIHGCLHLFGYDHAKNKDAKIMESLEVKILKHLDIPSPYEEARR